MFLKLSYNLKQKLIISQKMQQSLNLLSLSHEELKETIQKELLENPLLEEKPLVEEKIKYNNSAFRPSYISKREGKENPSALMEDFLTEPISLKSYVLKQAELSFFPKKIKVIVSFLISFLDERGYLNLNLEELAKKEKIHLPLLKEALSALQSLEPEGIGARNLEECLLIQLKHKKRDTKKACLLVQNHIKNLKEKKYKAIAYDLNLSLEETKKLCHLIQSLEPNPAREFSDQPTVFVYPDIYIIKEGDRYHPILNQKDLPHLKYSHHYAQSIRKKRVLKPEEQKYLKEKIASAYWFINAIKQREKKIKQIAYYLIDYQKDFLNKGASYLKPLKMQDLADEISVNVSTISRAVNNKYAQTPQGLIALKSFFQKGLLTEKGVSISVLKIKSAIKKWIAEESPENPLSDSEIQTKIYKEFHIYLLRRSVSQYRASLGIPSFKTRKFISLNSQDIAL